MTKNNSTKKKPVKPYPEFPLFPHNNGQWCRKIRGKIYSFGVWDDPTAALEKHNREYSFLKEGVTPAVTFDGWRVGDLLNEFLSVQEDRVRVGEIGQIHFDGLAYCAKLLLQYINRDTAVSALRPDDFRKLRNGMMERFQPVNCRANMVRIRSFFKFAYDEQMIDRPVFYGRGFRAPTKSMIRKARNAKPKKLFTARQVQQLLEMASPSLKAMILLSINTGMNNADVGHIQWRHLDLSSGWMDYPRHKTGIQRRAKLWPETIQAIEDYRVVRQTPFRHFDDYIFITKARNRWSHTSLPTEFAKLIKHIESIEHGSFGYLRHTFATVAGGCRDQVAVNSVMGHVDSTMAAEYREEIEDDRLEVVADHVRNWLFEVSQ